MVDSYTSLDDYNLSVLDEPGLKRALRSKLEKAETPEDLEGVQEWLQEEAWERIKTRLRKDTKTGKRPKLSESLLKSKKYRAVQQKKLGSFAEKSIKTETPRTEFITKKIVEQAIKTKKVPEGIKESLITRAVETEADYKKIQKDLSKALRIRRDERIKLAPTVEEKELVRREENATIKYYNNLIRGIVVDERAKLGKKVGRKEKLYHPERGLLDDIQRIKDETIRIKEERIDRPPLERLKSIFNRSIVSIGTKKGIRQIQYRPEISKEEKKNVQIEVRKIYDEAVKDNKMRYGEFKNITLAIKENKGLPEGEINRGIDKHANELDKKGLRVLTTAPTAKNKLAELKKKRADLAPLKALSTTLKPGITIETIPEIPKKITEKYLREAKPKRTFQTIANKIRKIKEVRNEGLRAENEWETRVAAARIEAKNKERLIRSLDEEMKELKSVGLEVLAVFKKYSSLSRKKERYEKELTKNMRNIETIKKEISPRTGLINRIGIEDNYIKDSLNKQLSKPITELPILKTYKTVLPKEDPPINTGTPETIKKVAKDISRKKKALIKRGISPETTKDIIKRTKSLSSASKSIEKTPSYQGLSIMPELIDRMKERTKTISRLHRAEKKPEIKIGYWEELSNRREQIKDLEEDLKEVYNPGIWKSKKKEGSAFVIKADSELDSDFNKLIKEDVVKKRRLLETK